MADENKTNPNRGDNEPYYSSDIEMIVLTDENTEPATVDESFRRYLEKKYGVPPPPADCPAPEPPPAQ